MSRSGQWPGMAVKDAAAQLGVSPKTVGRWMDEGIIRGWRVHPGKKGSARRLDPVSVRLKKQQLAGLAVLAGAVGEDDGGACGG